VGRRVGIRLAFSSLLFSLSLIYTQFSFRRDDSRGLDEYRGC
jgi:hypothetical protein